MSEKLIGYTAGAFDLFHVGHLRLLERSKSECDFLIVGITVDKLIEETKHKVPFIPFNERKEIVEAVRYVDMCVPQTDLDKIKAWEQYHYDILFSGDDWKGNPRFIDYENRLNANGVKVMYFPYTKGTCSTKLQKLIDSLIV